MSHYYTNNVDLETHETRIPFQYRKHQLTFISDIGVFSKERVDYGSRVLLDCMDIQANQRSLLDVGCGYGTLGVSLKKEYPWLHVEMVDVNERAVHLANQSCQYNVVGTFDVIVSNPPIRAGKKVVFEILEKAFDFLNENGELIVVIQKKQGAPSAQKKMNEVFGNCEIIKRDKGYFILKSIRNTDF